MRPELWRALDALAAQQEKPISTNALLEEMAGRVTGAQVEAAGAEGPVRGEFKKVTIRLREPDRVALRQQAAATGHTMTGWVTALVRARVRKAPLMAVAETEALIEANRQLAAVGRNLNTVVRILHRNGRWAGNLDLYAELLSSVKSVRARVEAVVAAALERAEET